MVPLIGYVDRFSGRRSERIAVKVSSRLAEPYQADLVRIVHGDANPAGPGLKFAEVAAAFAGTYPSRFQPVIPDRMGLWRPNVEDDYDKDVYNGDLGIVSRIDLMGPRTTNLRLEAISSKAAAVHRKPLRRRSAAALQGTKPIPISVWGRSHRGPGAQAKSVTRRLVLQGWVGPRRCPRPARQREAAGSCLPQFRSMTLFNWLRAQHNWVM